MQWKEPISYVSSKSEKTLLGLLRISNNTFGVKTDVLQWIYKQGIVTLMSYALRAWGQSLKKLVMEVQSVLYHLEDCDIHFSYVLGHSGNFGNDRANQLTKETTCQDMNVSMSVLLSHWKHLACFHLEFQILGFI
ncbi:hypothetical protein TNCV_4780011 [Trichonephila clavipes]|nr:hypothetical protein TNCV_4780011 [Trichonephila clavipes]